MPTQQDVLCLQIVRYVIKPGMEHIWKAMNSPGGDWIALYRQAEGYLGTDFYSDPSNPSRCMTVDTWESRAYWNRFMKEHGSEFEQLSARSRELLATPDELLADVDYSPKK